MEYQITIETDNPIDNFMDELQEQIALHDSVKEVVVETFGLCGKCKNRTPSPFCEEGGYCAYADDYVNEDDDCETGNFEPKEA